MGDRTHFVLLLHAGDYREAADRRVRGESDRYRHHSYALGTLESLQTAGSDVSVVQMYSSSPYDSGPTSDGIRYLGLGGGRAEDVANRVRTFVDQHAVTHVMLRAPSVEVLTALLETQAQISVVLADSFPSRWRHRARYRALGKLLADERVDFLSNHHLNSSLQLVEVLGVDPRKVVPWDWPLDLMDVARTSVKPGPTGTGIRLCFVGAVDKSKGTWDALESIRIMRAKGVDASLEIAGTGQMDRLQAMVARFGLEGVVHLPGRIGGHDVIEMMQRSSFVCVPSLHRYPEGLPLTIYEAMASGTPLIASDHPMFDGVVVDGETGFTFKAGRPAALAATAMARWQDVELYHHVSKTAAARYGTLGLDSLWGELVRRWVRGDEADHAWFRAHSLAP